MKSKGGGYNFLIISPLHLWHFLISNPENSTTSGKFSCGGSWPCWGDLSMGAAASSLATIGSASCSCFPKHTLIFLYVMFNGHVYKGVQKDMYTRECTCRSQRSNILGCVLVQLVGSQWNSIK